MNIRNSVFLTIYFLSLLIQHPADAHQNSTISQHHEINLPDSLPEQPIRLQHCLNGLWDFKCDTDIIWTQIRVPGCYSIAREGKWARYYWNIFDYPNRWTRKGGTYRRSFEVLASMNEMNIHFYCGGCFHQGRIYVNGMYAGKFNDGYFPFEVDVGSLLKSGENIIEIVVDSTDGFTDGCENMDNRGVWQDTYLKAYPTRLVIEDDIFLITSVSNARIQCEIPVRNKTEKLVQFFIRNFITDASGEVVFIFDGGWQKIAGTEREIFICDSLWETARLWFPHDPYLYQLHTVLYDENGSPLDMSCRSFGFREISWQGPHLYFNGRKLFLRGNDGHSLGDIQGTKEYARQWIQSLKNLGLNFMRLSHYPRHKVLVETADELGFLLVAEPAFNEQIPEHDYLWQGHLEQLIKTYRNHPSVIMWSLSDKLIQLKDSDRNQLINYIRSQDHTRPVYSLLNAANSVQSDVIGHQGDAEDIFNRWDQSGANKSMMWSEIGNVRNPKRPLHSGSAGTEITSQDYATGTWYDGCYQIYDNLARVNGGAFFDGIQYQVNAVIIPNFAYNFLRWQPINNHQGIKLEWPDFTQPGIKGAFIKSISSTVNIWDQKQPIFEPLPGFYCFEKYLQPVRFFDIPDIRSFFSGDQIVFLSKLIYEDLQPADELKCWIETRNGDVLWENSIFLYLVPGDIQDEIELYFDIPVVDTLTEVHFVRQFYFEDEPGFAYRIPAKIYPKFKLAHISEIDQNTIGVPHPDQLMQEFLREIKIPFNAFIDSAETNVLQNYNLILSSQFSHIPQDTTWASYFKNGGKLISLVHQKKKTSVDLSLRTSGAYYSIDSEYMFTQVPAYLKNATYIMTALDDFEAGKMTVNNDNNEFLSFRINKLVTVYVGYDWRPDELPAWLKDWQQHDERICTTSDIISFRIYSKQFEPGKITLGHNWSKGAQQMYTVIIRDLMPEMTTGLTIDSLRVKSGKTYEIVENGFVGSKQEIVPAARYLLNGSKHRILSELGQEDFTLWNGGAIHHSLIRPEPGYNSRIILSGDKDGKTSALHESFQGAGVAVFTSLNIIPDFQVEPVAGWLFKKMIEYVLDYQVENERPSVLLLADTKFRTFIDSIAVIYDVLESSEQLLNSKDRTFLYNLSDSLTDLQILQTDVLDSFTTAGGKVFIPALSSENLEFARRLIHPKLNLTAPYQGETKHCVKAAISWTRRDTPKDFVEYYDNILVPQPFEPNYDPLLTGISNDDLHWDDIDMFEYGVEIEGMNPVALSDTCSILMSNWKIDWSRPEYGGEYIHAGKDERRANWFLNRNAVTLKIKNGDGYFLICQLDLPKGGKKGRRLMSQLLTGMGVAIGQHTFFSLDHSVFDFTDQMKQKHRFSETQLTENGE